MKNSSYIIDREPLKYGGQQKDYLRRRLEMVFWGAQQIKESLKDEKTLIKLFYRLLDRFMQERQKIAHDHHTLCAEEFGRRRDEIIGPKEFYHTIMDGVYKEYTPKMLTFLADHLRGMSLENKQTSQKNKKIEEMYLGRRSSVEIEIYELDDLAKSEYDNPLIPTALPIGFPLFLIHKRQTEGNLTAEEWKILKQAFKMLKEENPIVHNRWKLMTLLSEMQSKYPSPMPISLSGRDKLDGNEAYLKSFCVLATSGLQMDEKLYPSTQCLTWLYRDFVTHPVDRMLKYSTVMVIHQDNFLIEPALLENAHIFAKAVLSDRDNKNELEQNTGLLRYYFANTMPCERGSSSIGEMFEGAIYLTRDLEVQYNAKNQIDLESVTTPLLSHFMKNYRDMIDLKPTRSH